MRKFSTTIFLFILLCLTASASAATFVVNTTNDSADILPGNGICADPLGNCSLRAAISEANALAGADIITLNTSTYTNAAAASPDDDANLSGDLDISTDITINGVTQGTTIIQAAASRAAANDRVLDVILSGKLTLNNVTVRHGRMVSGVPQHGGGIRNRGMLILTNVTVTDNETAGGEGNGGGGGIGNEGAILTLTNTTITGNFVNNIGGGARGAGLSSTTPPMLQPGTINITNSNISGNFTHGTVDVGTGAYINGVFTFTALNSHFDNNTANGVSASSGTGLQAVSFTGGSSTLNITGCTFNGNTGSTGPDGSSGVGIQLTTSDAITAGLNVTLDKVTVNGNTGNGQGVGINVLANGGGITLEVKNSTISNNTGGTFGGGVRMTNNGGNSQSQMWGTFRNSTLSGNSASVGGGLSTQQVSAPVQALLEYCTIANNSAAQSAGGLDNFSGPATINIALSVVAGNTAPNGPDIFFSVNSFDYNHIGNLANATINGTTTNNTTGDAMLGALQDNGGPTLTHRPAAGSPLVNSVPGGGGFCGSLPFVTDQRGLPRPNDGTSCDKGSVELNSGPFDLSGTVRTSTGMPIRNAVVVLEGGNLPEPIFYLTNNFGLYLFTDLAPGQYTVSISSKRYTFEPQPLNLQQDNLALDFTALPESRMNFEISSVPQTK